MKINKLFRYIGGVFAMSACFLSCNFLDVVPPEQPDLEDATQDAQATLGFLYSCYAGLNEEQPTAYTKSTNGASSDEYVLPPLWNIASQVVAWNQHSVAGSVDWRWGSLYRYIGQCHLFLRELENAQNVTEAQKREWKNEARFLVAYYHFCLLRLYGPVPITDSYIDMDTPTEEYNGRMHYDYVTDWICAELDTVAKYLPPTRSGDEWGRATSVIAKAIKARARLYAASPLWNGNFPYTNWRNKNFETPGYGKELVSLKYDAHKWEVARDACKEALDFAEANGHALYKDTTYYKQQQLELPFVPGVSITGNMSSEEYKKNADFLRRVMMFRYLNTTRLTDGNNEILWGLANQGDIVVGSEPHRIVKKNDAGYQEGYSGVSPTLFTVEHFYTRNGKLPKYDPEFKNESQWLETAGIANRGGIINLNVGREPRFYAWLAFDGGDYGCSKYTPNGALQLELRDKEKQGYNPSAYTRDHCVTGYLSQKYIQPAKTYTATGASGADAYPAQLIRLGELYLNLAECYAALGDVTNALEYLNPIRERAGIPLLKESDCNAEMSIMDWVRNERFVELWNEGHRYYDVRRWVKGNEYFAAGKREGLNAAVENPSMEVFNRRTVITQNFQWDNKMYLFPLFINEVYKNPQMIQAPGY